TTYWNFSERVDWNYSEKWKTFFRYGQFKAKLLESNPTGKKLLPVNGSNRYGMSIAADSVYTISTKMVLNVRANYHQFTDEYAGGHSLKCGGEYRVDRGKGARFEPITSNIKQTLTANANSSPNLNDTTKTPGPSGSEWATFMLGFIDNSSIAARVPIQEAVTLGYAGYAMDDYKVNKRLTLNLGLRWEYEPGPVDRGNRISQQLDLSQPIPEMQTTPPAIPATVTSLLASKNQKQLFNGAWIFTSADNRHAWNRKVMNLLPRLGGAYRIGDRSVVRFGWGRYLSPSAKIRDPL